jgi:hypothetical protein
LCTTGFNPTVAEVPPVARCGADSLALHLRANAASNLGLTKWGMNVGFDFRQNNTPNARGVACAGQTNPDAGTPANPCFVDASAWTGIAFWALLGPGTPEPATALATVTDRHTASQLGSTNPDNDLLCGDPPCVAGVGTGAGTGNLQCDPYGKGVGLVGHWAFYAIPFSDMRQKGYGVPESALEIAHLLGFKFNLGKGAWDVWLDDIAFYRPKSP